MEKKPTLLQFTMTYGAILGIVSIIFSIILYIAGYIPYNFKRMALTAVIGIGIMIVFLVMGSKAYRDKVLEGTISYGKALVLGMMIVVFATILSGFYSLIFNLFIDPEYADKVFEATKSWMYDYLNNMGVPDASIEQSMDRIEKQQAAYTPMKAFFQSVFYSFIVGFVLSLITSAFVKKNPNPGA